MQRQRAAHVRARSDAHLNALDKRGGVRLRRPAIVRVEVRLEHACVPRCVQICTFATTRRVNVVSADLVVLQ
jgi:hypothetical protein